MSSSASSQASNFLHSLENEATAVDDMFLQNAVDTLKDVVVIGFNSLKDAGITKEIVP